MSVSHLASSLQGSGGALLLAGSSVTVIEKCKFEGNGVSDYAANGPFCCSLLQSRRV